MVETFVLAIDKKELSAPEPGALERSWPDGTSDRKRMRSDIWIPNGSTSRFPVVFSPHPSCLLAATIDFPTTLTFA
jgi:hypothetical protein